MRNRFGLFALGRGLLVGALGSIIASAAAAQIPDPQESSFTSLIRTDDRATPREILVPLADRRIDLSPEVTRDWGAFESNAGDAGSWAAYLDARNGFVESAEGPGIRWFEGKTTLPGLERTARSFLAAHPGLFGTDGSNLRLSQGRSGPASDALRIVDFDVVRGNLVVYGARVVFRIGHGRLIQMGSERLPSPSAVVPPVRVTRAEAQAKLSAYVGRLDPVVDRFVDRGSLFLLPVAPQDGRFAEGFQFGRGYDLVAVWQLIFRRRGEPGTWRIRIDATTGEIVSFENIDLDAAATGGVAADSSDGTEVLRPMPWTDLGTGQATTSAGTFAYPGSPVLSTFNGLFVGVAETCGGIAVSSNASGDLPFGTTTAGNCATPGFGGAGNTRAARTSFYHVNRGKEFARGWLPDNAWLNSQLVVSVNNSGTCNGFWNGSRIQLFEGVPGSCGASGEEPGFILHEFGHGLDQNDGTGLDSATTEAYADVVAALALHNSCVAPGFRPDLCDSYGDPCTACSGLRDLDWARHASATPHTAANYIQTHCGSGGAGACGGEPHCEAAVPSEAIWDFANRDMPAAGGAEAWNVLERLWFKSRGTATAAFNCTPGPTYTSNGCNVGSWWKTLRALDDDDGNLANGTPHSCALFAAFNRHGIACPTDPGADVCFRACTPPAAPVIDLADGDLSTTVSWPSSGQSGVVYDVFRNEVGCNSGFTKVANDLSSASFADGAVADVATYFYQVVAHPAGNEACHSAPSPCKSNTKNAQLIRQSVPTTMTAGQSYSASVTVRNVGGVSWTTIGARCGAYRLAQVGSSALNPMRVDFSATVASGGEATLTFQVTAPSTAGSYSFQLRMVHECVEYFGTAGPAVTIQVSAGAKQAQVVSQTIPSNLSAGQRFSATVTIKNVGTQPWSPIGPKCNAFRLAQIGAGAWSLDRIDLPTTLAPGEQATVTIEGTAPASSGQYDFQIEMVHECTEYFGAPGPKVAVAVGA